MGPAFTPSHFQRDRVQPEERLQLLRRRLLDKLPIPGNLII
jgi:hypothetical protein